MSLKKTRPPLVFSTLGAVLDMIKATRPLTLGFVGTSPVDGSAAEARPPPLPARSAPPSPSLLQKAGHVESSARYGVIASLRIWVVQPRSSRGRSPPPQSRFLDRHFAGFLPRVCALSIRTSGIALPRRPFLPSLPALAQSTCLAWLERSNHSLGVDPALCAQGAHGARVQHPRRSALWPRPRLAAG